MSNYEEKYLHLRNLGSSYYTTGLSSYVSKENGVLRIHNSGSQNALHNMILEIETDTNDPKAFFKELTKDFDEHHLSFKCCWDPFCAPEELHSYIKQRSSSSFEYITMVKAIEKEDCSPLKMSCDWTLEKDEKAYWSAFASCWGLEDYDQGTLLEDRNYYILRQNEEVVGVADAQVFSEYGFLGGAAIHPQYRGRGFYKELLEIRFRYLVESGCKYVLTQCLPDTSAKILQEKNFEKCFYGQVYHFDAKY
jgi:GNAT superfamily N-acetyltransferase